MKTFLLLLSVLIIFTNYSISQIYQGPAAGSVSGGFMVTTDNFSDSFEGDPLPGYLLKNNKNTYIPDLLPDYFNKIKSTGPEGTNFVFDKSILSTEEDSPSLLIKSFPGVPRTAFIPPDASLAAGPTHIVGGVNSVFRIWDKQGNVIKTISAAAWLASVGLNIGANLSDPKIVYDPMAKRWIMAWITPPIGPFSYDVISVSDDSIPLGVWYNYAMRSDLNGSTPSNVWRDYEGVGYDAQAIYITGNGFTFSNSFAYSKLRIINKSMLYSNSGGPVNWFDMWDIRDPTNGGINFGIRPSIIYGNSSEYYLLCNSNTGGTYVSLYKLINPLTSPSMTAVAVPVITYSSPPNSGQPGTSTTIEAGGTPAFRIEPVFRNGFLYAVHAVRYNGIYSALKFYKFNVATNIADQDITFGQDEYFYSYPAISVDKNENILLSYSRSGVNEFIGAYYTTRLSTDPPNIFSPSSTLQSGKSSYVNVAGGRNRWGDYMGSWLDPVNEDEFWVMTEYADFSNNWGVWVGNIRIIPYSTARIFADKDSVNFGNVELGSVSDTQSVKIVNFGNPALTISQIQSSNSEFHILNLPSLPINLNFGDSINLKISFNPTSAGFKTDSIKIVSNDVTNSDKYIRLRAKGFIINPALANIIYGVTGTLSNAVLLTINPVTGVAALVGPSGFTQLNGVGIRPSNNQLYASISGSQMSQLVRINASGGDAYSVSPLPFSNIRAIEFDLDDILFCSSPDGKLYKYSVTTLDTSFIGSTGITNLYGLSINPLNGTLWAISAAGAVYKVNKQTAVTQTVGSTGVSPNTDIAFSKLGVLYGISGVGAVVNKLISIDTITGTGTVIGTNSGYQAINGLTISPEVNAIQNITTTIPVNYKLYQNYPNPFNPSTTIKFDIPASLKVSDVRLRVYNTIGKEVEVLVHEKLSPGSYEYKWDAAYLSSGVYFYRLEFDGNIVDTKRMILLK